MSNYEELYELDQRVTALEAKLDQTLHAVRELGKVMALMTTSHTADLVPLMQMLDRHESLALRLTGYSDRDIARAKVLADIRADMQVKREMREGML